MKAKAMCLWCGTLAVIAVLCSNSAAQDLSQSTRMESEKRTEDSAIEYRTEEGNGTIDHASQSPGDTGEGVQVIYPTIGHCGEGGESQVCASSNQTRLIVGR